MRIFSYGKLPPARTADLVHYLLRRFLHRPCTPSMARMGEKSSFLNSRAGRKPAVQLTARGAAKVGIAHLDVSKATTSSNLGKLVQDQTYD